MPLLAVCNKGAIIFCNHGVVEDVINSDGEDTILAAIGLNCKDTISAHPCGPSRLY